jgi:hypothetical protein
MKKILIPFYLFVTFLLAIYSSVLAQAPDVLWMKDLGESSNNCGYAVYETSDNGFMIGAYTVIEGQRDFYLLKTDGDGNMLWAKDYGQDARFESLTTMVQCSDGGYLLAGNRAQDDPYSYNTDAYIVKTDADGNEEWSSIFGDESISESINGACQTSDDGFALCGGYWASSATGYDVQVIKTNYLGLEEWSYLYNFEPSTAEYAYDIIETTSGYLMVTGETQAYSEYWCYDMYLLGLNLAGEELWINTYGSAWPMYEQSNSVVELSGGGFFLAGNQNDDGLDNNWYVVRTDEWGGFLWNHSFGSTYHDKAFVACEDLDGGLIAAGAYYNESWKAMIAKYSLEGDTLWTKMWGYEGLSQHVYDVKPLSEGGYIAVGSTSTDSEELKIFLTRLSDDAVGVEDNPVQFVGNEIEMMEIAPNPITSSAKISFYLNVPGIVSVSVYNLLGDVVFENTDIDLIADHHEIKVDATEFPSGIYFCQVSTKNYSKVVKLKKIL